MVESFIERLPVLPLIPVLVHPICSANEIPLANWILNTAKGFDRPTYPAGRLMSTLMTLAVEVIWINLLGKYYDRHRDFCSCTIDATHTLDESINRSRL